MLGDTGPGAYRRSMGWLMNALRAFLAALAELLEKTPVTLPPVVIPDKPTPNEDTPRPPEWDPSIPAPDPLPPDQSVPVPTPDPQPIPDPVEPPVVPDAPAPQVPDANGDYPAGYRVPWSRVQEFLSRVGLPYDTEHGALTNRSIAQCQTASTWYVLTPDGVPGPKTAKDWDAWERAGYRPTRTHPLREFFCRCIERDEPGKPKGMRDPDCEIVWISRDAVLHTQRTRDEVFKGPMTPNCAYRSPTHNARVGGVGNSQHVGTRAKPALAVDFPRIHTFAEFKKVLWNMLGIYGGHVGHADMRPGVGPNRTYEGVG